MLKVETSGNDIGSQQRQWRRQAMAEAGNGGGNRGSGGHNKQPTNGSNSAFVAELNSYMFF